MTHSLPATCRLRSSRDFSFLFHRGKVFHSNIVTIQWAKIPNEHVKFGVTVSKKFGSAVERNLFRRRAKEAFRLSSLRALHGVMINCKAKAALPVSFHQLLALFEEFAAIISST